MKRLLKEHILFILILFSCAFLRFLPLTQYQYTLDEWSGLYRTQFNSFSDLIEQGVKIDAHPALVQVLIYYLSKIFGYTDWIIKLPFLLMSLGIVIYGYVFCLRNFSKQAGLIASLIFSYSLVFVYYAPIARMYIAGVFFSTGLLYHFSEIFFLKNTKRIHFFFLSLFALLSALNQHINALFALTVCASAFLFMDKRALKPYIITCLLTIVCYLPHLRVTLYQLGIGGIGFEQGGWLPVPKVSDVWEFSKVVLGTGRSYLVFMVIIAGALVLNRSLQFSKVKVFLLVIFLINFFIVYFYSVFRAPIFQYSVMLFAASALVMMISSLISFRNDLFFNIAFAGICILLLFKTYLKKDYLHQSVKNIFEYQFERTAQVKEKYGDALVFPVFFDADTFMRDLCFKKYKSHFNCIISGDKPICSIKDFSNFTGSLNTDYLVLASSFPVQQAIVKERYPYLIESAQTQGLNYKVYSRKESDKDNVVGDDNRLYLSTPMVPRDFKYPDLKKNMRDNTFSLTVDSLDQFPLGAEAPLRNITSKEGQVILFKLRLKLNDPASKGISACISANDFKTDSCYSYTDGTVADFIVKSDSTVTIYAGMFCGTDYRKIKDKSKLKAYVWNKGKVVFKITGFEISTLDFWPQKWSYWE